MYRYKITGGNKLFGTVFVSGSKNASLPILAASLLNGKKNKLYNIPEIEDVKITLEILKNLGCKIKREKDKVTIDSSNINNSVIPDDLMRKLRSSVIIVGALISRLGKATFSYPGGCDIGSRPIDLHIENFKKMGIIINEDGRQIRCSCEEIESRTIELDFPSVGATENIILASILGNHEIIIKNCAMEPEIVDLSNFLNKMGGKVYGAGTKTIKIIGVKDLKDVSYKIIPDRIEAGTLLIATAITNGETIIKSVIPEHISPVINKLEETGCKIKITNNSVFINASKKLKSVNIKTLPYPGFPTDLQPIFSALLTICQGTSVITENIFENRFKFMQEIQRMGAKAEYEGKTMIIKGTKNLHGADVECTDLRGGAALTLAGITAKGITKVENIKFILRGYDNLDFKLNSLGANITREELEE